MVNLDSRSHPEVFVHVESHELRDVQDSHKSGLTEKPLRSQSESESGQDEKWTNNPTWSAA